MSTPSYIVNPDSHVTIAFADGTTFTTYSHEPIFDDLKAAVVAKDWDKARDVLTREVVQMESIAADLGGDQVVVEHGVVYLDGEAINNTVTDRIIRMRDEGFDVEPMKKFLVNLMKNPSFRAVEELYGFLEATGLPITDDGHFLAYKKVRDNYTDCYSGRMDNSVGATPSMPRNRVNENPNETCSSGLHFCGRYYLPHFGGKRIMVVKVNPEHVVSIPVDYNNAKGRASQYEVVQELECVDSNTPVATLESMSVRTTSARSVQRLDVETGAVLATYRSVEDAEYATGIRAAYIERVLRRDRKSTGGFAFRWGEAVEYDVSDVATLVSGEQADDEEVCDNCLEGPDDCDCCDECGEAEDYCNCCEYCAQTASNCNCW